MTIEDLQTETEKPVIIANDQGLVTHLNEAFEKAWGWGKENLLGQPMTQIIPEELRDAHNLGFSRFLATESPTLMEQELPLKIVHMDGTVSEAIHYIIAGKENGQWFFGATITTPN